ncbi:WD40-repeat-containing domain protein [Collybia nuda]|uniref:WD40-repeat-containing domain protein n=1 Tax=Collybia nuda TaxID=64659 RepID=A0A9P5Y1I4_9AGAR|nr:WD40-repeat-containing domain protein [Collybia nuda]
MEGPPAVEEYTWTPPQYDTSRPPSLAASLALKFDPEFIDNFSRMAKWCPDGSVFLSQCENRTFQMFNTPPTQAQKDPHEPDRDYSPICTFHQPSPILDFIWYPAATPLDPASFCFIASVRECPVKLLDAADGRLRASYRIVDHRERQIAPHSLAFNQTAERLYCGFEDAVEVFDFARPGEGTRLMTTPSKKSKDGLKGIISALAFVPSQGLDMYAAGSLLHNKSNIALFTESHGAEPEMFVGGGPRAGVTQILFNPAKPHIMYAAFRRHTAIYSWDIRSNVDSPVKIYHCKESAKKTNQKIRFDVDLGGRWLSVGDQSGNISMFDLYDGDVDKIPEPYDNSEDVLPTSEFKAHNDAVGSVAFHPLQPTLLSVSGSRHFRLDDENSDLSSSSDESDDEQADSAAPNITRPKIRSQPITLDSSMKIWNFDSSCPPPSPNDAHSGPSPDS